ncbi:alginate export family protein [Pseudomonas sp. TWI672]|uniref:alginate export family protein n=1 Tax=unclassified Pseudomonas TaxID=196821 RepID=UPI0032090A92
MGALPNDRNDGTQQRIRTYFDFKKEIFRAFLEIGDNKEYGAEFYIPSNYDAVDVSQAFVDVAFPMSNGWTITARPGRFNMPLGSGILVGLREGNNVRYTYDGIRVMARSTSGASLDIFKTKPTEIDSDSFDDGGINSQSFEGMYWKLPFQSFNLDLYYYRTTNELAYFPGESTLHGMVGNQVRRSYGARIYGLKNNWDYDLEGVYQNGHFRDANISAWAFLANFGYTIPSSYPTRFGVRMNVFSGDESPGRGDLTTFEPPFPRTAHLSDSGLYALMNIVNVAPSISVRFSPTFKMGPGASFMWLENSEDAFYWGGSGRPLAISQNGGSYLGSALNFQGDWSVTRNLNVHFYVERLWAGPAMKSFGAPIINYAGFYAQCQF